jgi:hypothetical protein
MKHLDGKRRRSRRVGSGNKWYQRERNPVWVEAICSEQNDHLKLGGEDYMVSADGFIMLAKKGQAPPDLKFFNQPRSDGDTAARSRRHDGHDVTART